jgi:hypothetical protein
VLHLPPGAGPSDGSMNTAPIIDIYPGDTLTLDSYSGWDRVDELPSQRLANRERPGRLEPGQSLTTVRGACLSHSRHDTHKRRESTTHHSQSQRQPRTTNR